jgi:hypothetical protein
VYVADQASIDPRTMRTARGHVERVLRASGVEVIWVNGPGPRDPGAADTVTICLLASDMEKRKAAIEGPIQNNVLAKAAVGARRSWIFYDRVQKAAWRARLDPGTALGRTIAHEIGHLAAGIGHDTVGAMRASLDLNSASFTGFTAEQSRQLRSALQGAPADALARQHPRR